VRPFFYPSSQGDPAYVSLSVLENRPDLGRTVRLGRTIQCSRRASVPRAALRSALGYLLLPLWGGRIGSRPEARGQRPEARGQRREARGERREGTAKQPENFGAILSRYPRITQNAGTVPGYFLRCALVSIPSSQGDPAEVSLRVLQNRPKFGPNGSPRANDPMLPSRKRTQGGASLCPGLSPFAPLGRTDRWIWLATWQRLAKS
jgi:hypothetical protein